MTLIQPNKQRHFLNALIIALSIAVTGAVVALIFVYNQTVSDTQGAAALQDQTNKLQSENSDLKRATFALLDPDHLAGLAASEGLSSGGAPHYVTIATWVAASHF